MKYTIVLFITLSFSFVSCNQAEKKETSSDTSTVATAPGPGTAAATGSGSRPSAMQPKGNVIAYEGNLPCAGCPNGAMTSLKIGSNFMYTISEAKDGDVAESKGYYNLQKAFEGDPKLTLFSLTDIKTGNQRYFVQSIDKQDELILLDSKKKAIGGDNPYKLVKK